MNVHEVMNLLESYGDPRTKVTHARHGASEPHFGVKVGDLKKIVKKVKKNHDLSLELFRTGNADAMYLAGLIADENKITSEDLEQWIKQTDWFMISEYTIAWIAAESQHGWALALKWIKEDDEVTESAGWSTLSNLVSIVPDEDLDIQRLSDLLDYVAKHIHQAKNRVRYTMNQYVICCGCYVLDLQEKAMQVAGLIGKVSVNMGDTACKVPLAGAYIQKVEKMGRLGKKRKMARC